MNDYERNFGGNQSTLLKFVDLLSIMIMLATTLYTVIMWPGIPNRIATHFNGAGEVDGYGSKWTLIILLFLMLFMYLLTKGLSKFPKLYNYPVKITDENREVQYELASVFLHVIIFEVILMFGFIQLSTVRNALNSEESLSVTFILVIIGLTVLSTAFYVYKSIKNK